MLLRFGLLLYPVLFSTLVIDELISLYFFILYTFLSSAQHLKVTNILELNVSYSLYCADLINRHPGLQKSLLTPGGGGGQNHVP